MAGSDLIAANPGEEPSARVFRILLVDDEEAIRESLKECLEELLGVPLEVEVAADGEEARARMQAGASFDMVLSDEKMPLLRGIELLSWMRGAVPRTVRVMMTGQANPILRAEARDRADVALLIPKPFVLARDLGNLRALLVRLPPKA